MINADPRAHSEKKDLVKIVFMMIGCAKLKKNLLFMELPVSGSGSGFRYLRRYPDLLLNESVFNRWKI